MINPKFILLSNSECAKRFAKLQPGCIQICQSELKLEVYGNTENSSISRQIQLPEERLFLRKYLNLPLTGWFEIVDWLEDIADPGTPVIMDFDHPLRELMLIAQVRSSTFSYGFLFCSTIDRILPIDYALLGSAKMHLFEDEQSEASFRKMYIGPYTPLFPDDTFASRFKQLTNENIERAINRKAVVKNSIKPIDPIKKRLLIVSYFSGPCRTVGVQRVNYWAEQISNLSNGDFDVHLATAIDWTAIDQNVHYIPDLNLAAVMENNDLTIEWASAFNEVESQNAKYFNTLSYYWRYSLETYFDKLDIQFDAVVISGNPFAVFDFTIYAKRYWNARTLLDYRDPFANNPRMKFSDKAREYARYVEKGYNIQADLALVVNDECLDYIESPLDIPACNIPNGFDERVFENFKRQELPGKATKFVHAGSLFYDRSPRAIIEGIQVGKHEFHHIGNLAGIDEDLFETPGFTTYGLCSYSKTMEILSGGDCGIVYVSEKSFETPTKVYEYIALGLDILICTHGKLHTGALTKVLQEYPGVYWCKNNEESVREFLKNYTPNKHRQKGDMKFSRRHAAQKLIAVIEELLPKS